MRSTRGRVSTSSGILTRRSPPFYLAALSPWRLSPRRRRSRCSGRAETNLFAACCRDYGEVQHARARAFSLQQGILLYAVILHRIAGTLEPRDRLRALRNIVEWSGAEIRLADMPAILDDVDRLMIDGDLEGVRALNQTQVVEEVRKSTFLAANPEFRSTVHRLEDHDMLRGAFTAFELDAARLADDARTFESVFSNPALWIDATGALLSFGEYQRKVPRSTKSFFGTTVFDTVADPSQYWRDLFAGQRERIATTREALMRLLNAVAESDAAPEVTMRRIRMSG